LADRECLDSEGGEDIDEQEKLSIRGMAPGDLDGVLALARRTAVFNSQEIAVLKELVEIELANPNQRDYRSLVVEEDGRIIGYACHGPTPMTDGTYDLYWILVHPSHQRRAIGSALLGEVERAIQRNKGRMLLIDTSSTRPYLPARRFYQNHGFRKAAEVKDYYSVGDSRLTYMKQLANESHNEDRKRWPRGASTRRKT
jgi:ribosomal protein S18 acetylase RimI-like enzyme